MNLFSGNELDPTDQPEAALIFGGDGTIHRHLGGLALKQIPTLVVPLGSANDFAHAIGIETVEKALAAWQRFCTVGDNLRTIDLGTIQPLDEKPLEPRPESSAGDEREENHLFPGKVSRWSRCTSCPAGPRPDLPQMGARIMQSQLRRRSEAERELTQHHVLCIYCWYRPGCRGESPDAAAAALAAGARRIRGRADASAGRFSAAAHHAVGRSGRKLANASRRAGIPDRRRQRAAIRPRHAADPSSANGRWVA